MSVQTFEEFRKSGLKVGSEIHYNFPDALFDPVVTCLDPTFIAEEWEIVDGTYSQADLIYVEWILYGYLTGAVPVERYLKK